MFIHSGIIECSIINANHTRVSKSPLRDKISTVYLATNIMCLRKSEWIVRVCERERERTEKAIIKRIWIAARINVI